VQIDPDTRTLVTFSWKPEVVITSPVQSPQGQYQKEGELLVLTIPGSEMQTGLRVQIQMRLIHPGTFLRGSRVDEQDRDDDEGPVHEVEITKPFYMGIYEVTQAQYGAVMGSNPSQFKGMDRPVENLTKANIDEFIERLNTMGIGKFRLPTEAEWEYACRAGTRTRFPWGDDPSYSLLDEYAWWNDTVTHPVGQKKPNPWGLYDMHGNVWEMCVDTYGTYPPGRHVDPINIERYKSNVCRGGSVVAGTSKYSYEDISAKANGTIAYRSSYIWYGEFIKQIIPKTMRSANRDYGEGRLVGFRLVREVD
jgi:formylglycine-generating enzyme required for sulfatase activity